MNKSYPLLAVIALCFAGTLRSQSKSVLEDQAYANLNKHDYVSAYADFDKLFSRYPKENDYEFKLGICALNYPEKNARAIELFKDLKVKLKSLEAESYLGMAYHKNYKFDEALAILEPLVDTLSKSPRREERDMVGEVKLLIMNCENGKLLVANKVIADIDNIGGPINTNETEGVPIITADESQMIFTYVGKKSMGGKMDPTLKSDVNGVYTSDIFISKKDATSLKWLAPEPLTALNTKGNDAAIAISPDGQSLYTFLSTNNNEGDIMESRLIGGQYGPAKPLNANVNSPEYWEGSCSISADGKFLYFASERPTGLGGKDIYVSEFTDGDWGPAVNLGPNINTIYDDDAPFIHPDGITLFFSSKGHQSIGGYDIMFSIKEGNEWTMPKSMGIPLNTVEDDRYYVINSKGDKGYFSSTRSVKGSLGEQDIYQVTPGILGEKPVVALLKGTVLGDEKPIEAKIEFTKLAKQEALPPYFSNKETGKYLMALSPGGVYRVKVSSPGFNTVEEDFDVENLGSYMEKTKDFYLYTGAADVTVTPATVLAAAKQPDIAQQSAENPNVTGAGKEPETTAVVTQKTEPEKVVEPVVIAKVSPKEKPAKTKPKDKEGAIAKAESGGPCNGNLPSLNDLKGRSLNDVKAYSALMDLMGNYCSNDLVFSVQVGAYRKPENFKTGALQSLGAISSADYPDGITRFTQKQFKTLKDAEQQRRKCIAKGQTDAWIVAFVDGKRYTLEDLIMVDFLGKAIN